MLPNDIALEPGQPGKLGGGLPTRSLAATACAGAASANTLRPGSVATSPARPLVRMAGGAPGDRFGCPAIQSLESALAGPADAPTSGRKDIKCVRCTVAGNAVHPGSVVECDATTGIHSLFRPRPSDVISAGLPCVLSTSRPDAPSAFDGVQEEPHHPRTSRLPTSSRLHARSVPVRDEDVELVAGFRVAVRGEH